MAKRKLSPDEKDRIAEERRTKEVAAHPNKMISVRVEDETDENGAADRLGSPYWRAPIQGLEAQRLKDQKGEIYSADATSNCVTVHYGQTVHISSPGTRFACAPPTRYRGAAQIL